MHEGLDGFLLDVDQTDLFLIVIIDDDKGEVIKVKVRHCEGIIHPSTIWILNFTSDLPIDHDQALVFIRCQELIFANFNHNLMCCFLNSIDLSLRETHLI